MKLLLITLLPFVNGWGLSPLGRPHALQHFTRRWADKAVPEVSSSEDVAEAVIARCTTTNRFIECFVDWSIVVKNVSYFVLQPCDEVVAFLSFDGSGEPNLIDPLSKEMDDVFPVANALFEEDDIHLMRTANVLTMQGDLENDDNEDGSEDDEDEDDEDDDADEEDGEEEQGQGEKVEVLADFEIEDKPYSLVRFMEPVYLIAKLVSKEYVLLSEDEGAKIAPLVEESIDARGGKGRLGLGGL
jgi:hypothetical protein